MWEYGIHCRTHAQLGMVHSNEEEIKNLFRSLLLGVQSALQSQNIDISDVRQFLHDIFQGKFPETSIIYYSHPE